MRYKDFLKIPRPCPFCEHKENEIVLETEHAFLTYSLAPYHKHHILVIPKRHVEEYLDLTSAEHDEIRSLLEEGVRRLEKLGYNNFTILVRNGNKVNKSVPHLHYHVIPNIHIGDIDAKGREREVISAEDIEEFRRDFNRAASV